MARYSLRDSANDSIWIGFLSLRDLAADSEGARSVTTVGGEKAGALRTTLVDEVL